MELTDTGFVRLLVDTVREEETVIRHLKEYLGDTEADRWNYQARYLDLVDTANGNAYVTMGEGQEKTIYWAAPEGLAKDGRAEVYRFDALNRSRDLLVEMILKENPPRKIEAERVEIQGRTYFKFSTAEFATFVLRYEEAEPQPDLFQLTVVSGSGAGRYAAGAEVQITADPAPEGKEFDRWSTGNGGTFGNESVASTTFRMPGNAVTVTALYKDKAVTPEPQPENPTRRSDRPYRPHRGKTTADTPVKIETAEQGVETAKPQPAAGKEVPYTGGAEEIACWLTMLLTSLTAAGVLAGYHAGKKRTSRIFDHYEDL